MFLVYYYKLEVNRYYIIFNYIDEEIDNWMFKQFKVIISYNWDLNYFYIILNIVVKGSESRKILCLKIILYCVYFVFREDYLFYFRSVLRLFIVYLLK